MSYAETLSGLDVEFGKRLWQNLRTSREFPLSGMFWLFEPDAGEWHLLVASAAVDQLGPRDAYRRLTESTRQISADSGQLLRIQLISPKDPMYQALRSVFGQTASVEGARLGNTQVGGMYIDDAYLYEVR